MTASTVELPGRKIYAEGDPEIPQEFRELLTRMLTHHLENSTNPNYTELLNTLWAKGMTLIPDQRLKVTYAKLMQQEVEHGAITARILDGLGVGPVDGKIKQYLFHLPIDTFCDLAFFNALGDRVGCYIGETWDGVPYAPLLEVADRLHKDEVFHATFGMNNLRRIVATPEGLAEANEKVKIWWPAALDMFGRSDSDFSDVYVKWGLRQKNNEELRQQYIVDTRPMLEKLGIAVPADTANRRFL
ncbi:possible phenylacetic acid degradation protein (plasmid) [Rhodococcus jostii RHA1]|uniref:Possible phenylacetic acid degradation protein n=1 Tax=Rhodococcus jostii (strain RHA1) TaxID=101510 RepID=Q0S055_RHOJR|nr:Phenylacetic acid catabolic protein [Rhodococcus jostii]ABG99081.1 possible phenylacetic acid degradation protein [Rhodococcus jostii RHA1]